MLSAPSKLAIRFSLMILSCMLMLGCAGVSSKSDSTGGGGGGGNPTVLSISGNIAPANLSSGTTITLSGPTPGSTTADASGNYAFTGLKNGTYTITPQKSGITFIPASQSLSDSNVTVLGVNFSASTTPAQTFSISGSVTPAASGAGATLTLSGTANEIVTADASGNFTFSGLPNGSYTIAPAKSGFGFNPASQSATINGADVAGIDFVTAPAGSQTFSISGTISPAVNAPDTVVSLSGAATATTTPDASGNYSFAGLPNGSYTVTPSASGMNFSPASQPATVNGANVTGLNFNESTACTSGSGNADFYVATYGNDSWSGTQACPNSSYSDGPFATMAKAQQAVRTILQNPQGRSQPVIVMMREGSYYQSQPVTFTSSDSGTSTLPVVWQNYPGETPVISGGMRVQNWTNVNGNRWQATLNSSTQYFENLYYNGARRLRPRLGGGVGTYYRIAATVYLNASPPPSPAPDPNCTVYMNGLGWECFDRFQYNPADPISATWANLQAAYPQGDIELGAFEKWTMAKMRIRSVDTTNHIVYFTGPTVQTDFYHGLITTHRYVVENVKDTLSEAGQWFLDRAKTPWTLTYLANPGEDPNTDLVIVPQASIVISATGLQYVTFQGLTFEHDNFVIPSAGWSGSNGEPTIPGAVSCNNCQHVTFDGVTLTQIAGTGIEFDTTSTTATTAYNTIQNSAFYDIGGSGIRIGSPATASDTDANVDQFTTAQNNVIEGYGRILPGAAGLVQGSGHDNLYTHNEIFDGYHDGIDICALGCFAGTKNSRGTFNNVVSFNHIYHIYKGILDDGGAIYFNIGNQNASGTGNRILNNRVHDTTDASIMDSDGYGGIGIYLDAESATVDVENNLVYRVSGNAMLMPVGPNAPNEPNTIKNNIFAYGRNGMISQGTPSPYFSGSCPSSPILGFNATNNLFYFDRSGKWNEFYVQRGYAYPCGFAYTQYQNWQSNLYWRTDGSFATDTSAFHVAPDSTNQNWTFYTFAQWQTTVGEDVGSVVKDPGFNNPAYPADDYSLPHGSPGIGFVVFDTTAAGRTSAVFNPPTVPDTFTTQLRNPATDY